MAHGRNKWTPPDWRFVAAQLIRLAFDLWCVLPLLFAVTWICENAKPSVLNNAINVALAIAVGFAYVLLIQPSIHSHLSSRFLGPWLAGRMNRRTMRRILDPTTGIAPWVVGFGLLVGSLDAASRMNSLPAMVSSGAGVLLGLLVCRTIADLLVGRCTENDVARSLLELGSVGAGVLLLAAAVSSSTAILVVLVAATSSVAWAASAYLQVAVEKVKAANTLNRDFGVKIHASGPFLKTTWRLVQLGTPVALAWKVFETGRLFGFMRFEPEKELVKARGMFLSLLHQDRAVIDTARAYNARFQPTDRTMYSESLKNSEALALMWRGELDEATSVITKAIGDSGKENAYFVYTHARILWHKGGRQEGLGLLNEALALFSSRYGRDCMPGYAHKVYFLWEIALDHWFDGDRDAFRMRLGEAEAALSRIRGYGQYHRTHDLIHNEANLELLRGYQDEHHVGFYRDAAERFVWCLWNGSHIGARLRLALLHAIGANNLEVARAYLRWIDNALTARRYGSLLPFVQRIRQLKDEMEVAVTRQIVLTDHVIMLQGTGNKLPPLEWAKAADAETRAAAQQMRQVIFAGLSVAWRAVPVSNVLSLPI